MSKSSNEAGKSSKVWTTGSAVSAIAAAAVAKKALTTSWRAATGKNPPANPADPDVELWEAVAWAVASGTIIALARMLAARKAAQYYARSTGHLPGELRADGQRADKAEAPSH
ncbi:DUF4235 domain-containing protein [Nocardioides sp. CPCC 205120]|uniref:DUF4235 domain-containing protein n=1 Tax=Nocardioides sp. CPCC 205120 TaxID=3406462 RepID=UPI003B510D28